MRIITLITDFGTKDFYVGALKGALLVEASEINLIDISHHIDPFDINEAAFVARNAFNHFPKGTIHIISVNDKDRQDSRYVLIKYEGHYFLGADSGIFSLIFDKEPELVVDLEQMIEENSESKVFNQVLAFAVGALVKGKEPEEIGRRIHELRKATSLNPVVQDTLIRGTVIYIDSFQNVITNIRSELFEQERKGRNFVLSFKRNERMNHMSTNYFDVPEGEKLSLFNAAGYLEIAINKGRASSLLGLNLGDTVQIDFE